MCFNHIKVPRKRLKNKTMSIVHTLGLYYKRFQIPDPVIRPHETASFDKCRLFL